MAGPPGFTAAAAAVATVTKLTVPWGSLARWGCGYSDPNPPSQCSFDLNPIRWWSIIRTSASLSPAAPPRWRIWRAYRDLCCCPLGRRGGRPGPFFLQLLLVGKVLFLTDHGSLSLGRRHSLGSQDTIPLPSSSLEGTSALLMGRVLSWWCNPEPPHLS